MQEQLWLLYNLLVKWRDIKPHIAAEDGKKWKIFREAFYR